jgi:hypothetical protein
VTAGEEETATAEETATTEFTQEQATDDATAASTPAAMPVTGAGNENRGLAIMLTVAAVLTLLIGLSLWEKRSEGR